jgi:hypothetical protein
VLLVELVELVGGADELELLVVVVCVERGVELLEVAELAIVDELVIGVELEEVVVVCSDELVVVLLRSEA